jgi:hypothetical protein
MDSKAHTFHSSAIAAADGTVMNVSGFDTVAVQIEGTASAIQVDFKATVNQEDYESIMGMDMGTLVPSTSTTSSAKIFQFDVRGFRKLMMDISSITSTTGVTIKGFAITN